MLWTKNRQREKSRQLSLIEFRPLKYSSMLIFDKFRIRGLIPRAHMWAYQLLRLKSSWRWGNCVVLPPPRVDNCSLKNALIYLKIRFETNIIRIDQALIKQKIICPAHWGRTKAPEYINQPLNPWKRFSYKSGQRQASWAIMPWFEPVRQSSGRLLTVPDV